MNDEDILAREERRLLALRDRARAAERQWRATPRARRSARARAERRWRLAADLRQQQQLVVDRLRWQGLTLGPHRPPPDLTSAA